MSGRRGKWGHSAFSAWPKKQNVPIKQRGSILLPVVAAIALLAAITFMLNYQGVSDTNVVAGQFEHDRLRYIAEAGIAHGKAELAKNTSCDNYADIAMTSFAGESYTVRVNPSKGSPVKLKSTVELADGKNLVLNSQDVSAYQPATTVVSQLSDTSGKDTFLEDSSPDRNYGSTASYKIESAGVNWRPLLEFDLSKIPAGAKIHSATLELRQLSINAPGQIFVHRLTRDWEEGTKNGGGAGDGASWNTFDGATAWATPGGEFDSAVYGTADVSSGNDRPTWDIATLVQEWVSGTVPNHGLMLKADSAVRMATYVSRETNNPLDAPKLTIVYACECGMTCEVGSSDRLPIAHWKLDETSGTIAVDSIGGHDGTLINDPSWSTAGLLDGGLDFDGVDDEVSVGAPAALDNVFNGGGTVTAWIHPRDFGAQGGRIVDKWRTDTNDVRYGWLFTLYAAENTLLVGRAFSGQFGYWHAPANSVQLDTWQQVAVVYDDSSDVNDPVLYINGAQQVLTEWFTPSGTPMSDAGGVLTIGDRSDLGTTRTFDGILDDVRIYDVALTAEEIAELASDAVCEATAPLLFVVSNAASPTSDEQARQSLLEGWCYAVTLIGDGASQAEYDAAIAVADVVYVSSEVSASSVSSKLKPRSIGIVNEDPDLHDDFGFSTVRYRAATNAPLTTVATHYITSPFGGSNITLYTSDQQSGAAVGTLPSGLVSLGDWSSGALSPLDGLLTLDTGATISGGGTAVGRRVQLPWDGAEGGVVADIGALTADGRMILRRSLEWAAGTTTPSSTEVVYVVSDPASLSVQEEYREKFMIDWGFTVLLLDDDATETAFAAVLQGSDPPDAVYVSQEVSPTVVTAKLADTTIGVVNESRDLLDDFGFASSAPNLGGGMPPMSVDTSHYITSTLTNPVSAFGVNEWYQVVNLPVASGVQSVGAWIDAPYTGRPALMAVATGGQLIGGSPSPGRRVQLPMGSGQGAMPVDINGLTADGRTIIRRSIEWAAGAGDDAGSGGGSGGGGGPAPVFESFADASASSNVTSLNVPKPSGTAAGDLLIAALATDGDSAPTFNPPSGWTAVNVGTSANNKLSFGVWWKIATGSEPSQYSFTWSGGEEAYGWVSRFTGHDPGSPIIYDAGALTNDNTSTPICQKLVTTEDSVLILRLGGFDDDDITVGAPGLDSHTAINMGESGTGTGTVSGGSGYMLQATAGDTDFARFQLTNNEEMRTVTLGIRPAP